MRYSAFILTIILSLLCLILGIAVDDDFYWPLLVLIPLALLGTWDLVQTRHSITRNYPIIAHMRFLFESIRPEIHQYFVESNIDGHPFNHDARSLIYERAKNIDGLKPFGTELDVYSEEYEWLNHSMAPIPKPRTVPHYCRWP